MNDTNEAPTRNTPVADSLVSHVASLDAQGKATLRRSLAFAPGAWPTAFPYVEPWIRGQDGWRRSVAYLVAGLQSLSRAGQPRGDFGDAARRLWGATGTASTEQRFIAVLEADSDELPHRLRQMVALMNAYDLAPDWERLRRDLVSWPNGERFVQQRWARSFYARPDDDMHAPKETVHENEVEE